MRQKTLRPTPALRQKKWQEGVEAAGLATMVIALCGGVSLLIHQAWLIPSLGPTIYLQVEVPELPSAQVRNVLIGHGLAIVCATTSVLLITGHEPHALGLSLAKVVAACLAILSTLFFQALLSSYHAPAAATALLIALGGLSPTPSALAAAAAGVLLIAGVGEAARRWQSRRLNQVYSRPSHRTAA